MTQQQAEEMKNSGTVRYAHIYKDHVVLVGWNNVAQVVAIKGEVGA